MAYVFDGTDINDSFTAPAGQSGTARGLGGNDSLTGNTGSDDLNGNVGNDVIFQGDAGGTDTLRGGQGSDTVYGSLFGSGGGSLNGNRGQDLVIAASGGSTLFGGQDNDTMYGGTSGSSRMVGDLGDDVLYSSSSDLMIGGDGNDRLYAGAGNQNMFGGSESAASGSDTFFFEASQAAPAGVTAFTTAAFGRSQGGFGGADTINFFDAGDQIRIGQLDTGAKVRVEDTAAGALITITGTALNGAQAADQTILVRGQTRTTLLATGSNNVFVAGAAFDLSTPGVATDVVAGTTTFTAGGSGGGGVSGLTINGTEGPEDISPTTALPAFRTTGNNETINALGGADSIDGGGGNDIINAGAGADSIKGGAGSDNIIGGNDADRFIFNSLDGVDTIGDFVTINDFIAPAVGLPNMVPGLLDAAINVAGTLGLNYQIERAAGLTAGTNAGTFFAMTAGVPTLGYNSGTGNLFYDADGSALGSSYVLIANLTGAPVLNATEFLPSVA